MKPENVVFESKDNNSDIKIIDFGLSNKFATEKVLHTIVGTPVYVSPSIIKGDYDCTCDCWSAGVIMYILLCGNPPFLADNKN